MPLGSIIRKDRRSSPPTCLIEGIHFDLRWTSLADLGDKSLAVNLSDIAAMGGVPAYAMLSLGIPANFDSKQLDELYRGINGLAKKHGVTVVGGDTNLADSLLISVCVIGHPPSKPICRSGAQVGDDIYVTGTLGDAALGLALLRAEAAAAGPRYGAIAQAPSPADASPCRSRTPGAAKSCPRR